MLLRRTNPPMKLLLHSINLKLALLCLTKFSPKNTRQNKLYLLVVYSSFPGFYLDCYYGIGKGYQGNTSVTISGNICQSWSAQCPHRNIVNETMYPELANASNFCRNPGGLGREGPWCFTTNHSVTWEYCAVPKCPKQGAHCTMLRTYYYLTVTKLQLVQNYAARILSEKRKYEHITPTLKQLDFLPISDLLYLGDAVLMFKCMNTLAPEYLSSMFTVRSAVHSHNTRNYDKLQIPKCRISLSQQAFNYSAANI